MKQPAPALLRLVLLTCAFAGPVRSAETRAVLGSAAEVRSLASEAAAESRPVRLQGQLLLVTISRNALVLLDRGEGIYVQLDRPVDRQLRQGDEIEVVGVSDAGDFAPLVRATQIRRVGPGVLPPPRLSTVAELNAGGLDAAWIEVRGIVRGCAPRPGTPAEGPAPPAESWLVTFAQGADKMSLQVNGRLKPDELVDAKVRIRAVVFNVHNANRQFVRANLQVPHPSMIEVLAPPPADPFARPVQQIAEVLRFSRDGFSGHRVHVRGVVIGHQEGQALWLQEGDHGMRIASTQPGALRPGDEVEVAGFPDHGSYTPSLSDAVFRTISRGQAPVPRLLRSTAEIALYDANLVQIYATLRDVHRSADTHTLVLDWNGREVSAQTLRSVSAREDQMWVPGSLIRASGICVAGQTDYRRPTGRWMAEDLQLLLRGPEDVTVLRPAPWLTARRVSMMLVAVALVALSALIAVAIVARRKLRQREEARKLAEVEFSAMLAERNRMARDIHDTLAQDLNAVSMQLELARNAFRSGPEETVRTYLGTAHEIVRKCLAEARESIWNMRSHILERNDLPGALRLVAEQLGAGSGCTILTQVVGRSRRLAPAVENNLLRIGQEAVSNALKHARADRIEIELTFESSQVRLIVHDNGAGFEVTSPAVSGSHFGLRGMRERVAQMSGTFSVSKASGGGTRVEVVVAVPG